MHFLHVSINILLQVTTFFWLTLQIRVKHYFNLRKITHFKFTVWWSVLKIWGGWRWKWRLHLYSLIFHIFSIITVLLNKSFSKIIISLESFCSYYSQYPRFAHIYLIVGSFSRDTPLRSRNCSKNFLGNFHSHISFNTVKSKRARRCWARRA